MNYKVLYRKYRPDTFENIIGQDFIIKTLKNTISNQKIAHAYIFTGPKGTGKTSTAKVFAKVVNCLELKEYNACGKCFNCLNSNDNPDIIEIDAASNNGVDEIRELRNNIKIAPNNSKYKIYIIDEVHMLSTEAFNALLKTLEEPPPHIIFILATTDIQKVPLTILSRCQRFDFKKISKESMVKRLKEISELEKIVINDEAINEIAYITDGSFRDALSLLDQLNIGEIINLTEVTKASGSVSNKYLNDIYNSIIDNDSKKINSIIYEISNIGVNYKFFVEKLIQLLRNKALELINSNDSNIKYIDIKKIIFELVESLNISKNVSDPFLMAELILLEQIYRKNSKKSIDKEDKIISREIISDKKDAKKDDKEEKVEKKLENEPKIKEETLEDEEIIKEFKRVRINNCFVSASKEELINIKKEWEKFLDNIKTDNKSICSLLLDSNVVTASDKYAIIEVDSKSQSRLLNKNLSDIEKNFNNGDKKYKFIFLTKLEWDKEKKEYIKNKKNNFEYKLLKEIILKRKKEKSKIETVALEIFDNNKIVVK